MDRRARFCGCGKYYVNRFGFVGFYSPFFNQLWFAVKLVCSLCEATTGSLSEASTAVSLAKVCCSGFGRNQWVCNM
jgi:hypothetical protein